MANQKNQLLLRLGKAQIDGMFARRQKGPAIDDSDFIPLLQTVLTAFETAGFDPELVEELWKHAYARYDQACKEAEPTSTTAENRRLMQGYLRRKSRR
jgi:hypothetical protein